MNLYEKTLVFEVGLFWDSMLMAFISLLVYQQFLLHSRGSGSNANLCECLPVSGGQDGARAGVKGQREREREKEREREREREALSQLWPEWVPPLVPLGSGNKHEPVSGLLSQSMILGHYLCYHWWGSSGLNGSAEQSFSSPVNAWGRVGRLEVLLWEEHILQEGVNMRLTTGSRRTEKETEKITGR